ncbi:capsular biosynthesis protein [Priestia megaterium]|uniref:polysaccharide pyruvyl transferase family protein n=1 Tax=Priestia megaterium TaxID=1404 RepID=UPI000BF90786|nr:polysaccharide pyruvyl transferase family protein [Priestia megaterium]PEU60001.1 capsular biosynthesis protein [Priestia megaterium]
MKKITILDTSVATKNVGDEIIVDSVEREIFNIFKDNTMFFSVPTHEVISRHSRRILDSSNYSFVAGTNLLSSRHHILKANQWNINLYDAVKFNRIVLMGVGWSNYQNNPGLLSKLLYKQALDSQLLHSVRDNYTKEKLNSIGIKNVINTGCATMWNLTPEHCSLIPKKKGKNVVTTLTDYRRDIDKDKKLINILQRNYDKVYIWVQGSNDFEYISSLSSEVTIVHPTLKAFDQLLDNEENLDYVGTRLHAGIRAMQKKVRSIIIGVDNRALEKKQDFNVNVINREDIDQLEDYVNSAFETSITLDFGAIANWKSQFTN